jgi:hypothetical protein
LLPLANQNAQVEGVSKAALDLPADLRQAMGVDPSLLVLKHAVPVALPARPSLSSKKPSISASPSSTWQRLSDTPERVY